MSRTLSSPPFTVSTVCLRRYPFARSLEVARELGFDAVDLVGLRGLCEHVPPDGSREELRAVAAEFRRSGLRAASVNADPGSFDGADPVLEVRARVERLLEFCEAAGAPLLVLPCGEKTTGRTAEPRFDMMAEELNRAAETAASRGIRLAVEAPYFGRPIDTLDRTATLLELLAPEVQLAYDVSHVEAADESVVDGWHRFADRVAVVHLRDAVSGNVRRVIGAGRVDFAGFLTAVADSSFAGDVVLELETRDSPYASKEEEVLAAVDYLTAATA